VQNFKRTGWLVSVSIYAFIANLYPFFPELSPFFLCILLVQDGDGLFLGIVCGVLPVLKEFVLDSCIPQFVVYETLDRYSSPYFLKPGKVQRDINSTTKNTKSSTRWVLVTQQTG